MSDGTRTRDRLDDNQELRSDRGNLVRRRELEEQPRGDSGEGLETAAIGDLDRAGGDPAPSSPAAAARSLTDLKIRLPRLAVPVWYVQAFRMGSGIPGR